MTTDPQPDNHRPTREECIADAAKALVRGLALYARQDDRRQTSEAA